MAEEKSYKSFVRMCYNGRLSENRKFKKLFINFKNYEHNLFFNINIKIVLTYNNFDLSEFCKFHYLARNFSKIYIKFYIKFSPLSILIHNIKILKRSIIL